MRFLIPDANYPGAPDIERAAAGPGVEIDVYRYSPSKQIAPESVWRACDAIIVYAECRVDESVLRLASNCRIVARAGVGFDNIDLAACGARGIPVCNTPDYGTTEVADHTLAMLLALVRGIMTYDELLRTDTAGNWMRLNAPPALRRIRGATFGVIGMGRIGAATARRARAFDMQVVFYDPYVPDGTELALGFERVQTLDELLARSDIVSVHTPLTPETHFMIGDAAVAAMKPGAILINTARGPIVDTSAVHRGLESGRLAAAGLDVLPIEPPETDDPLIAAWREKAPWIAGRLLLSPHAAFYSAAGSADLRRKSTETAVRFLREGVLRNCVNLDWLDRGRLEARRDLHR
jgi:phosphoglycerate dehydrogenase-like enzyme